MKLTIESTISIPLYEITPVGDENPKDENWYELNSTYNYYSRTNDTTIVSGKDYYAIRKIYMNVLSIKIEDQ